MSDGQAISTRSSATDQISFDILLNGKAMNGQYGIMGLQAFKSFNRIASAKIIIADGDPAKQDFAISSKEDALTPGNKIEIAMGYHAKTTTIFKGFIVKHAIKSAKGQHSVLTIEARDMAIKLTTARKSQTFADKKDSDIIQSIAQKAGYDGGDLDLATTMLNHKQMVQSNTLDWDFIVSRAEMNGMLVLADSNKLVVKAPVIKTTADRQLAFGIDVLDFECEIDGDTQLKQIKSHAWSPKEQKLEDSPEASIQFTETGNLKGDDLAGKIGAATFDLYHTGDINDQELTAWSNAQLLKSRLAMAIGKVTIRGTNEINVGDTIQLVGFSDRFNGNVLVTGVLHSYHQTIWESDIQFGMPQQWYYKRDDIVEKPASGMVPGINGLHIGVVLQLESDPENEHRIKIKLPLLDNSEGLWARVASLDAGNERGAFFRPEINDEVVVGFLNDDPRCPVVIGMLNSSAKPAPITAKDANDEKGFTTRSKMKLLFDDNKKIITIETPAGKKIEINEDSGAITLSDENQNKISMNSDGISIESPKNIAIKSSGGDVKIEGLNIENKASAKFSAEGNANAQLQSSGPTVVKGAIVSIN